MTSSPFERTLCPRCAGPLETRPAHIRCAACGAAYPRLGRVPVLLAAPGTRLRRWALELALLEREGEAQLAALEQSLDGPALLPETTARCRAMVQAARDQAAEIKAVMQPLLAEAGLDQSEVAPQEIGSPLLRLHYLYRDWGWRGERGGPHPETTQALAAVQAVAGQGAALGRTLVLGGGACRLAYDLVRHAGASEVAVLDLDPVLLSFAEAILRGTRLHLTEPSLPVVEQDGVARVWELSAPEGPATEQALQLFLADGLAPPFAPGSFDTVVTPWFIDQVPGDLRDLVGTLVRMLVPGGRWINHGPLIYPAHVPPPRRFTREEIFALAEKAGFRIDAARGATLPHLVSPVNGRGRCEWTLSFAATLAGPPQADAWLLLPHLPVPPFPGQSLFWHDNPLISAAVASIDGRRSIDDITRRLDPEVRRLGLDPAELKDAVRACLAAVHPACAPGTPASAV